MIDGRDDSVVVAEGIPPSARQVALIDYDGTLFDFGGLHDEKPPKPGAVETIQWLKAEGWKIVIFTSRLSPTWHIAEGWNPDEARERELTYIASQLDKWSIPFDEITSEKRPGSFIVDDTAIAFRGDWTRIKNNILLGGRKFDEATLAYASGFFDGAGSVTVAFYWRNDRSFGGSKAGSLAISANQISREPLTLFRDLFGGSINPRGRTDTTRSDMYSWKVSGSKASSALEMMLPFLMVKRKEAIAAIAFQKTLRPKQADKIRLIP